MPLSTLLSRLFRWGTPVLLAILGVFLTLAVSRQMEWGVYDLYSRWNAKQQEVQPKEKQAEPLAESPVTLILIDDASIEALKGTYGLPPWPRSAYLDIFRKLQSYRPAVTVFDGHFMYFERSEDRQTFDALRKIPHLVLGMVYQPEGPGDRLASQWLNRQAGNYYQLNLGVVNVQPSPNDGILRSVQPIWLPSSHTPGVFPSLALAAALEYKRVIEPGAAWVTDWEDSIQINGQHRPSLVLLSEQFPQNSKRFKLQPGGGLLLQWRKLLSTQDNGSDADLSHQALSLWRVLNTKSPSDRLLCRQLLSGKIALIGASSSLHQDFHHTPMSIHHVGVDIQATAIDNFLSGQTSGLSPVVAAPSWWMPFSSVVFFAAAFLLRLKVSRVERGLLYTLGTMVIYAWLAFWAFYRHHLWVPVVTPEMFLLLGFLVANAWLTLARGKEVALLEGHLSRLVSRSVFGEIRKMSQIITQGGRKLEITAMMVDIRNFTSLAENLSPQEVNALLNEFYEIVVGTVFAYRGTVDKFLGDGVMILFGAPINDERHAWDALRASLALVAKGDALCNQWRENLGIETEIGISLHSGSAFVGFIGPKTKLEYTAIGDTVNLCARLQEEAKRLCTPLIVSGATVSRCLGIASASSGYPPGDDWIGQYLSFQGEAHVRGREMPIKIWALNPAFYLP